VAVSAGQFLQGRFYMDVLHDSFYREVSTMQFLQGSSYREVPT